MTTISQNPQNKWDALDFRYQLVNVRIYKKGETFWQVKIDGKKSTFFVHSKDIPQTYHNNKKVGDDITLFSKFKYRGLQILSVSKKRTLLCLTNPEVNLFKPFWADQGRKGMLDIRQRESIKTQVSGEYEAVPDNVVYGRLLQANARGAIISLAHPTNPRSKINGKRAYVKLEMFSPLNGMEFDNEISNISDRYRNVMQKCSDHHGRLAHMWRFFNRRNGSQGGFFRLSRTIDEVENGKKRFKAIPLNERESKLVVRKLMKVFSKRSS